MRDYLRFMRTIPVEIDLNVLVGGDEVTARALVDLTPAAPAEIHLRREDCVPGAPAYIVVRRFEVLAAGRVHAHSAVAEAVREEAELRLADIEELAMAGEAA
jgi:hypothetical protein